MGRILRRMRRSTPSSFSLLFGMLALVVGSFGGGSRDRTAFSIAAMGFVVVGMVCGLAGLRARFQRGRAILGMLCCLLTPVFAVPPIHGPRWRGNESFALGDVRTVISAQAAYAASNADRYGPMECLSKPSLCIPGYAEIAPTFLDSTLTSVQPKSGYNRTFLPGPAAQGLSPSSMSSFAYVAVPIVPGKTGFRAFCGDASGMICATRDGSMPFVRYGRCVVAVRGGSKRASDCTPLR